jgi:hypothetical protein
VGVAALLLTAFRPEKAINGQRSTVGHNRQADG